MPMLAARPGGDTPRGAADSPAPLSADSAVAADTARRADTVGAAAAAAPDSLPADSPAVRSRIRMVKSDLEAPVVFSSKDSMLILRRDSAYMYGSGEVTYGDIKLQAAYIDMSLGDNTVYATGLPDSAGKIEGRPIFNDGGTDYDAATMRYNFKTTKGFITDVLSQQGEGYLTGGMAKKDTANVIYVKDGRYTTCDDHECPHFYFNLTKAKVVPGSNVVTGPVYMVLAGLPLPVAAPFGYFPFSDKYSSGILVPTFGEDYNRGFYLREGGYYLALNQNMDLALTGELYSRGSWGLGARSSYVKRYKYSGSFNVNYLKTIIGEKGDPDYSAQTNFQVVWSHTQDTKANPNMNLSASVNFSTSGYQRNDLTSYYSPSFTENTKSSTVNLTYRIPQSKWSLSASLNVSQRTQDSTLSVSFPNLTVTMAQCAPFKRKKAVGGERWYEKIRLSYSGLLQNSLTARQDQFLKKSLVRDWRNGMRHSVPVSATFNLLKYINFTPSINLNDRMYTQKIRRQWNPNAAAEQCDTTYSLYNVWDFSASVGFDTKVYGFYQPLGFLGRKVKMIRHVMTPSVSFSGAPDFGSNFFGYYGRYDYTDEQGRRRQREYSYFPNGLFGVPGKGRTGALSFSLSNNLEAKVKSDADSTGEKKISLIENLSLSQSYNFAADSLRWSNLNTSILLRLTKQFNLNLAAVWDVYTYGLNEYGQPVRVNKLRLAEGKGWGRLASTGTSFSYTLDNNTFRRKDDKDRKDTRQGGAEQRPRSGAQQADEQKSAATVDADGYQAWDIPWSLNFNYSVSYGYGAFNKKKMEYDGKFTQNLSLSGNLRPTANWNFSFTSSYDFNAKKLAYMNCNVSRDLHCFTMSASFVPVGPYKSFNFHIAVKSSMLSDLKYDKRSSRTNGIQWY